MDGEHIALVDAKAVAEAESLVDLVTEVRRYRVHERLKMGGPQRTGATGGCCF